jgi:glycosyltransferase involved in cell wall biosynthesis
MNKNLPLVTIGIPAYNREVLLKRAIESTLSQDYGNIEVIVSDNASTDNTESVCKLFCETDTRFKYIRHSTNRGPKANFNEVLVKASGQYFMWLGDDDWLDLNYISSCVQHLLSDPTIVLVSGSPHYYRSGEKVNSGRVFTLLHDVWWHRVVAYYKIVADNGMFYGLMPTEMIRNIDIPHVIGADWIMLANIVSIGKAKMLSETSIHRELGGMTASIDNIVNINGLPKMQAVFPSLFIAYSACKEILAGRQTVESRSGAVTRLFVAVVVLFTIISKTPEAYIKYAFKRIKK